MFKGVFEDYGCRETHQPVLAMGLPLVALARLTDRGRLRRLVAALPWRQLATVLLLAICIPLFLTAAVATIPVVLTVGLVEALRRAWQWRSGRRH